MVDLIKLSKILNEHGVVMTVIPGSLSFGIEFKKNGKSQAGWAYYCDFEQKPDELEKAILGELSKFLAKLNA